MKIFLLIRSLLSPARLCVHGYMCGGRSDWSAGDGARHPPLSSHCWQLPQPVHWRELPGREGAKLSRGEGSKTELCQLSDPQNCSRGMGTRRRLALLLKNIAS